MADPAVQKALLKLMLSLPTPVLRMMSGGGVVWQGGRTLDPRFQFLTAGGRARRPCPPCRRPRPGPAAPLAWR
jgi:acetyl esterase